MEAKSLKSMTYKVETIVMLEWFYGIFAIRKKKIESISEETNRIWKYSDRSACIRNPNFLCRRNIWNSWDAAVENMMEQNLSRFLTKHINIKIYADPDGFINTQKFGLWDFPGACHWFDSLPCLRKSVNNIIMWCKIKMITQYQTK